ncbi:MAG: AraC family transcriptional regulator [Bacteroidota bacterium]
MVVATLPDFFNLKSDAPIQLFDYHNQKNIDRSKVSLSKNTISFLQSGLKEVIGNDGVARISNDRFLVMNSGHCLMTEKISLSNQEYRSILLFFSDEAMLQFLEKYDLLSKSRSQEQFFEVYQYDQFITGFVASLVHISKMSTKEQDRLLKIKFEEIMLYLANQYGTDFLNALIQSKKPSLSHMEVVVERNKHNKLSLDELAFLSHMSVSTFKREFKSKYGEPPIKWFNEQRLHHIAALIQSGQKSPSEVFEEAGYDSLSNFIQAFKKQFGITPKQYQLKN